MCRAPAQGATATAAFAAGGLFRLNRRIKAFSRINDPMDLGTCILPAGNTCLPACPGSSRSLGFSGHGCHQREGVGDGHHSLSSGFFSVHPLGDCELRRFQEKRQRGESRLGAVCDVGAAARLPGCGGDRPRALGGADGTCVQACVSVCMRVSARAHMCMVGRTSIPSAACGFPRLPGHPTANSYVSQALGFSINDLEFGLLSSLLQLCKGAQNPPVLFCRSPTSRCCLFPRSLSPQRA